MVSPLATPEIPLILLSSALQTCLIHPDALFIVGILITWPHILKTHEIMEIHGWDHSETMKIALDCENCNEFPGYKMALFDHVVQSYRRKLFIIAL